MVDIEREIKIEENFIEKTLLIIKQTLGREELTQVEFTALGAFIHDIYTGIENILTRILKHKGFVIQDSPSSHKEVLSKAKEKSLIGQDVVELLDEYRAFRHFFRHRYGLFIDSEKLMPLLDGIENIWSKFLENIRKIDLSEKNKEY